MARHRLAIVFASAFVFALAAQPLSAAGSLAVMCTSAGGGADHVSRGVVIPSYLGTNVKWVMLWYEGTHTGWYDIRVTIRRMNFAGPQVGPVGLASAYLTANTPEMVIIPFGDAPVTVGDTLTLTHSFVGPAGSSLYFNSVSAPCTIGTAYETEDTTPPLSTLRRNPMAIWVAQENLGGPCIPSNTVMCIDGTFKGDRRFKVTVNYSTTQGGGQSGPGYEIPQSQFGVEQGGLFWFFAPWNPEMLIKVLNACYPPYNKFWVYFSAGTNVGFTVTVTDTVTSQVKTYTNADLHPADPVQDTTAFSTCP